MVCNKCSEFISDRVKVEGNIRFLIRAIDHAVDMVPSVDKLEWLNMLRKHLRSNTRVLDDLIAILEEDCRQCDRWPI